MERQFGRSFAMVGYVFGNDIASIPRVEEWWGKVKARKAWAPWTAYSEPVSMAQEGGRAVFWNSEMHPCFCRHLNMCTLQVSHCWSCPLPVEAFLAWCSPTCLICFSAWVLGSYIKKKLLPTSQGAFPFVFFQELIVSGLTFKSLFELIFAYDIL